MLANITWLLNNQGGESKKGAGMAMLAIFGQTSSLISSSVFPDSDAPLYTLGCALACAFTGLIAIALLTFPTLVIQQPSDIQRESREDPTCR
jgi:hypothetical protein